MLADIKASQEEMMAEMRAWQKGMKATQETTGLPLECKGPTSEDTESGMEHWEVPKEHATVETGKVPNKWHRG
jgi:hypothetical protein